MALIPRPLSDLPAETTQVRAGHRELHRSDRQHRSTAGGLAFGYLSERIGRANAITIAALIALPALPLWAYSSTSAFLALGAFVMQVAVQGAWRVVPAHLNELAPGAARATIPAFVYQAGNFLASYNGPFQAKIAEANDGNYACALARVAGVVAIADRRRHPLQPGAAGGAVDGALTDAISR